MDFLEGIDDLVERPTDVRTPSTSPTARLGANPEQTLRQEAARFGLKVSSGRRTEAQNKAVGGAPGSYHLQTGQTGALDAAGNPKRMRDFAVAMRDKYGPELSELFHDPVGGWKFGKNIGAIGEHSDHVHIAWGGKPRTKTADLTSGLDDLIEPAGRVQQAAFMSGLEDLIEQPQAAPVKPPQIGAVDFADLAGGGLIPTGFLQLDEAPKPVPESPPQRPATGLRLAPVESAHLPVRQQTGRVTTELGRETRAVVPPAEQAEAPGPTPQQPARPGTQTIGADTRAPSTGVRIPVAQINEWRRESGNDQAVIQRIQDEAARQIGLSPANVEKLTALWGEHPLANIVESSGKRAGLESILKQGRGGQGTEREGIAEFYLDSDTLATFQQALRTVNPLDVQEAEAARAAQPPPPSGFAEAVGGTIAPNVGEGLLSVPSTILRGMDVAAQAIEGEDKPRFFGMLADKIERLQPGYLREKAAETGQTNIGKLSRGAGSAIGFAPLAAPGMVAAGLAGGLSNAGAVWDEAKQAGVPFNERLEAAGLGFLVGTTEAIPVGHGFERALKAVEGKQLAKAIVTEGLEEFGQEAFLQGIGNNLIARGYWDKDRPITKDIIENGLIGFFIGGAMGGAAGLASHMTRATAEVEGATPEAEMKPPAVEAQVVKKPQKGEQIDAREEKQVQPKGRQADIEDQAVSPKTGVVPEKGREHRLRGRGEPAKGETRATEEIATRPEEKPQAEVAITEPAAVKTKEEQPSYASTQANLPESPVTKKIQRFASAIPAQTLDEKGRETQPHITTLYGLEGEDPEAIREVLKDQGPITATLGKTSIFPAKEGQDFDVVKIDVESPDLHQLNAELAKALPHTKTQPEYIPHVTIAYVKPGQGQRWAGSRALEGQKVTLDRITFSDKQGNETEIPLAGNKPETKSSAIRVTTGQKTTIQETKRDIPAIAKRLNIEASPVKQLFTAVDRLRSAIAGDQKATQIAALKDVRDALRPENKALRKLFTEQTGIKLPKSRQDTGNILTKWYRDGAPLVTESQQAAQVPTQTVKQKAAAKIAQAKEKQGKSTKLPAIHKTARENREIGPPKAEAAISKFSPGSAAAKAAEAIAKRKAGRVPVQTVQPKAPPRVTKAPPATLTEGRKAKLEALRDKLQKQREGLAEVTPSRPGTAPETEKARTDWNESTNQFNFNSAAMRALNRIRGTVVSGLTLTRAEARNTAKRAETLLKDRSLGPVKRANVVRVMAALKTADAEELAIVGPRGGLRTQVHEQTHAAQLALERFFQAAPPKEQFDGLPNLALGQKLLKQRGYTYVDDPRSAAHELFAHIAGGQWRDLGMPTGKAFQFFDAYLDLLGRTYKADALKRFDQLQDNFARWRDEKIKRLRAEEATRTAPSRTGSGGISGVSQRREEGGAQGRTEESRQEGLAEVARLDPEVELAIADIARDFLAEGNTDFDTLAAEFESVLGPELFDELAEYLPEIVAREETAHTKIVDAKTFRTAWEKAARLTKEEADQLEAIGEAMARGYVKMNPGSKEADFYSLFAGIKRTEKPTKGPFGQPGKGSTTFLNDGRAVIKAFQSADISTALHETAHVARRYLDADSLSQIEEWAGAKDGNWNRTAEEKFARGFERYFHEGKAPTPTLQAAFDKLMEFMRSIYQMVRGSGIDVKLSPEVESVFARVLGEVQAKPSVARGASDTAETKLSPSERRKAILERMRAKQAPAAGTATRAAQPKAATPPKPSLTGDESLTSAVIRLGRLRSLGYTGTGEVKQLGAREGGRIGLFSKSGLPVEAMIDNLNNAGYGPFESAEQLTAALDAETRGEMSYSSARATDEQIDAEWDDWGRNNKTYGEDHAIMTQAFDNPATPENARFIKAVNRVNDVEREITPRVAREFTAASRDIGLSDRTIDALLNRSAISEEAHAEDIADVSVYFQEESGLTTEQYDRVVEKLRALKKQGMSVDDYLAQQGLFDRELSPQQESLLRDLAAPKRNPARIAYDQALEDMRRISAEFRQTTKDYRARKIGVAEFLAAKKIFEEAQARVDATEKALRRGRTRQESLFETAPTVESRQQSLLAEPEKTIGGPLFQEEEPDSDLLDLGRTYIEEGVTDFKGWQRRFTVDLASIGYPIPGPAALRGLHARLTRTLPKPESSRIDENEHFNFRRSTFANPDVERAFRQVVKNAVAETGQQHKQRVTRQEHLARVQEMHPDLVPMIKDLRPSMIASRNVFAAAVEYAQTLTREAETLRTELIRGEMTPSQAFDAQNRIDQIEHDATEIMSQAVGVRSEFGRNLALLAAQKTDQMSPERVLQFAHSLAQRHGMEIDSTDWRNAERRLVAQANEARSAQVEIDRLRTEIAQAKRERLTARPAKPRSKTWQAVMTEKLTAMEAEALARLQERPNTLYQDEEINLPVSVEDVAVIVAARIARGGNYAEIIRKLRTEHPIVFEIYENDVKARADAILKDQRRRALVEASHNKEQAPTARQMLAEEVRESQRAVAAAKIETERKRKQLEATWQADSDAAAQEASLAWEQANKAVAETLDREADKKLAQQQRAFAAQQKKAVAAEAKRLSEAARRAEIQRQEQIAEEAREQLEAAKEAARQARENELAAERAARRTTREQGQRELHWDYQIRQNAAEARGRLGQPGYTPNIDDLAAIGAALSREIADQRPADAPERWHREMQQYGRPYRDNVAAIRNRVASLLADARTNFKNRRLQERAAGGREAIPYLPADRLAELTRQLDAQLKRRQDAQRALAKELAKIEQRSFSQRAIDALGLVRSLRSSVDLPFFRQSIVPMFTHPLMTARAMWASLSTWTEAQMDRRVEAFATHPMAELMRESGLDVVSLAMVRSPLSLAAMEEQFQSLVARAILWVRVSERQFVVGMDSIRVALFEYYATDLMRNHRPDIDPEPFQQLARLINIMTGRGDVGKLKSITPALNIGLWSTRLMVSRLQWLKLLAWPPAYRKMSPAVRRIAAKNAATFLASQGMLLFLAQILGLTTFDLDDDDFMKLRIPGTNTKYDFTGGFQQYIKTALKLVRSAYRHYAGELEFKGDRFQDTLLHFGRSKLAPGPSIFVDWLTGKNFIGEPFTWSQVGVESVAPMASKDIVEAIRLDGTKGLLPIPFILAGTSVSTFRSRQMPDRTHSKAERYATGFIRDRMGSKPETKEEYKRRTLITELVAARKSGQSADAILKDIEKAGGALSDEEQSKVEERVKQTPLERTYRQLSGEQKEAVLEVATPEERVAIEPAYKNIKMRLDDLKQSDEYKQMTQEQRTEAVREVLSEERAASKKNPNELDSERELRVAVQDAKDQVETILLGHSDYKSLPDEKSKQAARRGVSDLFRTFSIGQAELKLPEHARNQRAQRMRTVLQQWSDRGVFERQINGIITKAKRRAA